MDTSGLPDHPFTTGMARHFDLDAITLHRLVRAGDLRHPVRGVYVPTALPDTVALRCQVLRLVMPSDAFACDRTAAWLHAGDRALAPNEHLECRVSPASGPATPARCGAGLVASGEREIRPSDLTTVHGLTVTTPLRTALDLGRLQPTAGPAPARHGHDARARRLRARGAARRGGSLRPPTRCGRAPRARAARRRWLGVVRRVLAAPSLVRRRAAASAYADPGRGRWHDVPPRSRPRGGAPRGRVRRRGLALRQHGSAITTWSAAHSSPRPPGGRSRSSARSTSTAASRTLNAAFALPTQPWRADGASQPAENCCLLGRWA